MDAQVITAQSSAPAVPFSKEAEESLLGSVLISPETLTEVSHLRADQFYVHRHRFIWDALLQLQADATQIDIVTVADELSRVGKLAECGGPAYLTTLVSRVPNSLNAKSYAKIVIDRATRRKMINEANQLAVTAYDLDKPILVESPSERFALQWAEDVYGDSEPLQFLVQGLITKASVNLMVGEGGSKKTWAALDLGVCVATGADWLDFATEQSTVLIVDEESGPRRLRRRLLETLNGHLIRSHEKPPIAYTSLNMANLRNLADVNALHMLIVQAGAGLVIIDALADIMLGGDENSVKDVQPLFMHLRRVAEATGAAIVVIHHSNRASGDYRGSSAIKGAIDLMLKVESAPESKYISFSVDKGRDIEARAFTAVATWQTDSEQFYLTATDLKAKQHTNKAQRYVLRYLLEHGRSLQDDVTADPDTCSSRTARDAVYNLIEGEYIERINPGGGRGVKAEIELTVKGRELAERES